jgi:hypothetical protein
MQSLLFPEPAYVDSSARNLNRLRLTGSGFMLLIAADVPLNSVRDNPVAPAPARLWFDVSVELLLSCGEKTAGGPFLTLRTCSVAVLDCLSGGGKTTTNACPTLALWHE